MAEIVSDDDQDDGNPIVDEELESAPPPPPPAPEEDKLGKFKGKSAEDIAAAYHELEQRFGKQGEEVGELRKLTDAYIRSTLEEKVSAKQAPASSEPSTDDDAEFFINPRAAIKKLLKQDDVWQELETFKNETQVERARRTVLAKHQDADEVVKDPEFQNWVKASPTRLSLMQAAQEKLDVNAADELFSTFKELKTLRSGKTAADPAAEAVVDQQKKAAGAPSGTTASAEGGKGKPVYSRRKIMELMINKPEEYAARNDEFLAAYAEGRVRA